MADNDAVAEQYVARLNQLGIDLFSRRFAEIGTTPDGRGLVLLGFEPAGEFPGMCCSAFGRGSIDTNVTKI